MGKVLVPIFAAILVVVGGIGLSNILKEKPNPPPIIQAKADSLSPSPTKPPAGSISVFYISLSDNGKSGKAIGCGDSVVATAIKVPPTKAPLTEAFEQLLANHNRIEQSGFYNALYQSNLTLQSAELTDDVATIQLIGTLKSGGVCDDPRIIAQLEQTALQFSDVKQVQIFVNTTPLQQLLSGK